MYLLSQKEETLLRSKKEVKERHVLDDPKADTLLKSYIRKVDRDPSLLLHYLQSDTQDFINYGIIVGAGIVDKMMERMDNDICLKIIQNLCIKKEMALLFVERGVTQQLDAMFVSDSVNDQTKSIVAIIMKHITNHTGEFNPAINEFIVATFSEFDFQLQNMALSYMWSTSPFTDDYTAEFPFIKDLFINNSEFRIVTHCSYYLKYMRDKTLIDSEVAARCFDYITGDTFLACNCLEIVSYADSELVRDGLMRVFDICSESSDLLKGFCNTVRAIRSVELADMIIGLVRDGNQLQKEIAVDFVSCLIMDGVEIPQDVIGLMVQMLDTLPEDLMERVLGSILVLIENGVKIECSGDLIDTVEAVSDVSSGSKRILELCSEVLRALLSDKALLELSDKA